MKGISDVLNDMMGISNPMKKSDRIAFENKIEHVKNLEIKELLEWCKYEHNRGDVRKAAKLFKIANKMEVRFE